MYSYVFLTLVGDLEEEFDVEVNEREVAKVNTIGDIIEYITALQV